MTSVEERIRELEKGEMRIEVSQLPPAECSPNWRGSWAQRYQAAEVYQQAVYYESVNVRNILERLPQHPSFPFTKARLTLTLVFPTFRKRDQDNLRARFKPGQDALVQAQLILDDTPEYLVMGGINIAIDQEQAPKTIIDLDEIKRVEVKNEG